MSKQDRTYSRTPEDLERKYNLGRLVQGGNSNKMQNDIDNLNAKLENVNSWKLCGEAVGINEIEMPSNYSEIMITHEVSTDVTNYIYYKHKTPPIIIPREEIALNDSLYISYMPYVANINFGQILEWVINETRCSLNRGASEGSGGITNLQDYITTRLYYR